MFSMARGKEEDAIMLNSQSTGFKWFFNLYFNFLAKGLLKYGDIVVIDEIGATLHPQGLVELRKFGMTAKKLIHLKEAFYKSDDVMDAMFLAAFYGCEITLIVFNDGSGYIFDPYTLADYSEKVPNDKARIILELNPYINKALSLLNIPTVKISYTARNIEKGGNADK